MITNQTKFRPVYGTEAMISTLEHHEGWVYIASDTGKIFLDANNVRKQIGGSGGSGGSGSSSIEWAFGDEDEGTIVKDTDDASDGDPYYHFSVSGLDSGAIPDIDALIINSDGRFFRVLDNSLNSDRMFAVELIAVSGGGSGGGGGGGGTSDIDLSLQWDNIELLNSTYIYGKKSSIKFYPHSDADEVVYISIVAKDLAGGTPDIEDADTVLNDELFEFDTSSLPLSNNIEISVTINSDNSRYNRGKGLTKKFANIKTVEMGIQKVSNAYIPAITEEDLGGLVLSYIPIGPTASEFSSFTETLHVSVDGDEIPTKQVSLAQSQFGREQAVSIDTQSHGVHNIDLWVSTTVNRNEIESDHITFQAAWTEANNETPLIWFGDFNTTIVNYENASIPYMIYNPVDVNNGNRESNLILYKDGAQISELKAKYSIENWLYWDISALYTVEPNQTITPNTFTIQLGVESQSIDVYVTTEGSRDLEIKPAEFLLINLSAAGRSNSELKSNRDKWIDKGRNNSQVALTGFNWANNGWESPTPGSADYDSGSYLTIANGAKVTIPMGNYMVNNQYDYSFEFRFRVRNVQQYSTLVTSTAKYFYESYDSASDTWTPHKESSKTMKEIEQDPNLRVMYNEWGSPWDDEENVANEINITKGVICSWLSDEENKYGFVIGTQEAFFNSSKKLVRVRYKDDQILNLSFVISKTDHTVYIYLNGVPAGAAPLPTDARDNPVGWYITNKDLVFNSDYCDVDLFRVRMFRTGLSTPQVIHNYLADKHDMKLYDQNQLTKAGADNLLDYNLLVQYNENNPNSLTMPYATWEIADNSDNEILPYFKGNNRKCNITFTNPSADKLLDDGEITAWDYYTHTPSYMATGVDINVQGTSSQEYPRRNYKTKFKEDKVDKSKTLWQFTHGPLEGQSIYKDHYFNADGTWVGKSVEKQGDDEPSDVYKARMKQYKKLGKKFHVDAESVSTSKFTWKIDYMESSGTYNTGFANLMGNLQAPLYNKHPLADLGLEVSKDMRTTVYGFPVLTFHKFANGDYEYIGRYNMNLDKSSNEYYGFENESPHPYVEGKTIADVAECWEMKDNQGSWCSLKFPNQAAREIGFDTRRGLEGSEQTKLEMSRHYEVRYNPSADPLEAILGETLNYNDSVADKFVEEVGGNRTAHNHYLRQKFYNLERLVYWLDSTDTKGASENPIVDYEPIMDPETGDVTIQTTPHEYVDLLTATDYTGIHGATSTRVTGGFQTRFTQDSIEYRLEKFKSQLQQHLDLHYCLVYFILTELLLCFDSRGKNMMLATFGPHEVGGEYIWYPIFYDIDTQLGLNNSGSYLWDYDEECTENGTFSTATSVLWNNLWSMYKGDIITEYAIMRGQSSNNRNHGNLTYKNIVGAYECKADVFGSYAMMGVRPIIAIGLDEYYKYFATTYSSGIGYYTTQGVLTFEATPTYAYCCQGDKLLTTELLLRNRLNYIDSMWLAGDYSEASLASSSITARSTLNNINTSDIYLDMTNDQIAAAGITGREHGDYPVPYFDAVPGFKIKPFLKQYLSYYTDQISSVPVKYNDSSSEQDGVWTNVNEDMRIQYRNGVGLNDQIFKIPGADYISSLGDLSTTYLTRFLVNGGRRLLDLRIGSDVPGYKHNMYDPTQVNFYAAKNDSNNKPLLKQIILSKIGSLTGGLDFSGSSKLNEFRALDTSLSEIVFAAGAPLGIVHLPKTIGNFEVEEASDLTRLLTTRPEVGTYENGVFTYNDPETYKGLYIEGVTDLDINNIPKDNANRPIGHAITRLNIIGGNLGYGSYILLRNLVTLKNGAAGANALGVNLEDVHWTPYQEVEYGEPQGAGPYYQINEHGLYEEYLGNSEADWLNLTLNQKIFTKDTTVDSSVIPSLDLFDIFREDYRNASVMNLFTNLAGLTRKTYPYISGEMYIDNTPETAINESDLTDIYGAIWPDLTIRAKYINEAYLAKYVQRLDSGKDNELDVIRYAKGENVHPTLTTKTAAKQNYDFRGWTLNPDYCIVTDEEANSLINNGQIFTTGDQISALTFSEQNNSYVFYAVFSITSYRIIFKDPISEREYTDASYRANYGVHLHDPGYLATTDESGLTGTQRYKFLGWVDNKDNSFPRTANLARTVDLSKLISQNSDKTFYACFIAEDATENATDESYFTFTSGFFHENGGQYNVEDGYYISIAAGKKLSGKITLPTEHDGKPVIGISNGGFQATSTQDGPGTGITHIFWQGDTSRVRLIDANAFWYCKNLMYFQMPTQLRQIGAQAFLGCSQLQTPDFYSTKLTTIGADAFSQALYNAGREPLLQLPGSVVTIGEYAFQYYKYAGGLEVLQFGGPGDPCQLTTVGQNAFWQNQESTIGNIYFYRLPDTDTSIFDNALNTARYSGQADYPYA